MSRFGSRPGVAALFTGAALLVQAALARLLFEADAARVYFLGHPINWVCGFRSRFGLPCPTCGMTRSIVLSLHGDLEGAWRLAPAGPVAVAGLLAFACAALALAFTQWRASARGEITARSWIRKGALAYSAATVVVWLTGWTIHFRAALHQ